MPDYSLKSAQTEAGYAGKLQINVTSSLGLIPIQDAAVTISYTGVPDITIEKLSTDSSGQTEEIELPAPPLEYSLEPEQLKQPYSEYNIQVDAPGFEPVMISGTEILPDVTAVQPIRLNPLETAPEEEEVIVIPGHTLYEEYPPKIPEDEIKPMDESGEIVLSRVVIPEYVVVELHLAYLLLQKLKALQPVGVRIYGNSFYYAVPEGPAVTGVKQPIGVPETAGKVFWGRKRRSFGKHVVV